jgi:cytochrome o ubiquinol oxidase subunit 2
MLGTEEIEELRKMNLIRNIRRFAAILSLLGMTVLMSGCMDKYVVLDPKGEVGRHQLDLIVISTLLCLVIILPVLVLTFVIAWRYRNRPGSKASYKPEWEHNTKLELVWWGIPIVIILILAVITVQYTYKLEPSKPLQHEVKPVVVQVTSLDWKWLFQYPELGIATVNYVQFPADVPVRFELTSDAPMNSFWIPQLGGQIYTMSGMAMKLHLIADEPGTYKGTGANFSGKDFAKMRFDARATSQADFDKWVEQVKITAPPLTQEGYDKLAEPGTMGTQDYSSIPEGLFERIVNKYTGGEGHHHGTAVPEETPKMTGDGGSAAESTHHHH